MTMPMVVTVFGLVAIVSATIAFLTAANRGRSGDAWAFASFVFPPALLVLLLLPRRNPLGTQIQELRRSVGDLNDD